jgi:serine/threonine protein kinase
MACISEGTYGVIWKARDMATNGIVALKEIKFDGDQLKNQGFPITALRKISILLMLQNKCIVMVKEMVVGSMVMEHFKLELQQAMKQ